MTTDASTAAVSLGPIADLTFDQIRRNIRAYGLIALVLVGAPQMLIEGLRLFLLFNVQAADMQRNSLWPLSICSLVLGVAAYLMLIKGVASDRSGQVPTCKSMARSILIGSGSAMLLSIVISLGVVLGLALLIVPGVMLGLAWSVALPAQAVENKGVAAALKRSAELTHGLRWRLLGIMLAYVALAVLFSILVAATITAAPANLFFALTVVLKGLARAAITLVGAVLGAVMYFELRRLKEGEAPSALVEVFA